MLKRADSDVNQVVAICDNCGAQETVAALDFKEANAKLKPTGWICFHDRHQNRFKNHCPKCSGARVIASPSQSVKIRKSVLTKVLEYLNQRIINTQSHAASLRNENLLPGVPQKQKEIDDAEARADELLKVKKTIESLIKQNEYITQRAVRRRKQNKLEDGADGGNN